MPGGEACPQPCVSGGSCRRAGSHCCGLDGERRELSPRHVARCPIPSGQRVTTLRPGPCPPRHRAGGGLAGLVRGRRWDVLRPRRVLQSCHDDAAKFVHLLMSPGANHLVQEDFVPFLQVRPRPRPLPPPPPGRPRVGSPRSQGRAPFPSPASHRGASCLDGATCAAVSGVSGGPRAAQSVRPETRLFVLGSLCRCSETQGYSSTTDPKATGP